MKITTTLALALIGTAAPYREGIGERRGYAGSCEDDGLVCRRVLGNGSANARCGDRAYSFGFPSQHGCFSVFFFLLETKSGHADVHLLVGYVVTQFIAVDPFGSRIVLQVGTEKSQPEPQACSLT
jgi:hypothetical protein